MSILGNMTWNDDTKYMVARTSKVKATDSGHIYDCVCATALEQGMNVKLGDYTGEGLQERKVTVAGEKDEIVFICDVPLIYESYKTSDQLEYKFINQANKACRGYEIVRDDVIGISDYGFTTILDNQKGVQKGSYVTVDGTGKYKEVATRPTSGVGFIGQVIGFEKYQFDTVVLVSVLQNTTVA